MIHLPGHIMSKSIAIWRYCPLRSIQYPAEGERIFINLYPSSGKIGSRLNAASMIFIFINSNQNCVTISHACRTAYADGIPMRRPYSIAITHPAIARIMFVAGPAIATKKSPFTGSRKYAGFVITGFPHPK
jgi:hypothetical protein